MALSLIKAALRPLKDRRIQRLPSRAFLDSPVLPALVAAGYRRLLSVGTRSYVQPFYRRCAAAGIVVSSIDLDPLAATAGAPGGHYVGNICDIGTLAAGERFDVVLLNGVLGWGLNGAAETNRALESMRAVTQPGALLLVGWNPGKTAGEEIAAVRERLVRTTLGTIPTEVEFPPRGGAQRFPHRYEFFVLA